MIPLKKPRRPNFSALMRMAVANPQLSKIRGAVLAQYVAYRVDRNPQNLKPLSMATPLAKWLKAQYGSRKKSLGLSWIKQLRETHNLVCCPMCGGGGPATLDHILPKEDYPEFSVFADNLVPSCDPCNRRRSRKGARLHLIHPYFDHSFIANLQLTVRFKAPYDAVGFDLVAPGLGTTDNYRLGSQLRETMPAAAFKAIARSQWGRWHRFCYREKIASTKKRLTDMLGDMEPSALNSWEAAVARGLLADGSALTWMAATAPDA